LKIFEVVVPLMFMLTLAFSLLVVVIGMGVALGREWHKYYRKRKS